MKFTYKMDLVDVDWNEVKAKVAEDDFDNGHTPQQRQTSFKNSSVICLAYAGDQIVTKGRALSDGVCNAYIFDL